MDRALDEVLQLQLVIKERKIAEYKIQLAIEHNPTTEKPEELWNMFDNTLKPLNLEAEFDAEGMDRLKAAMAKGSAFLVK